MYIDLHLHTSTSFDSTIKVGLLMRRLKTIGLDGVAITDHDSVAAVPRAREFAEKYQVKVFAGVEVTTSEGHIIALGVEEVPPFRRSVPETIDWVRERGGIVFPAHPFKTTSPSLGEKIFAYDFDAVEINGRCLPSQNRAAEIAAQFMGKTLIGGSDAHTMISVGTIVTKFYDEINDEYELIKAIKSGSCEVWYNVPEELKVELIPPMALEELSILNMEKEGETLSIPAVKTNKEISQPFGVKKED